LTGLHLGLVATLVAAGFASIAMGAAPIAMLAGEAELMLDGGSPWHGGCEERLPHEDPMGGSGRRWSMGVGPARMY